MGSRIYVGDHQTLLHTNSVSSGPYGFREEDFLRFFSYTVLYKHMDPEVCGQFEPEGLDRQDLSRGPLHIATYKIYKLWAWWFHRRFFKFFQL